MAVLRLTRALLLLLLAYSALARPARLLKGSPGAVQVATPTAERTGITRTTGIGEIDGITVPTGTEGTTRIDEIDEIIVMTTGTVDDDTTGINRTVIHDDSGKKAVPTKLIPRVLNRNKRFEGAIIKGMNRMGVVTDPRKLEKMSCGEYVKNQAKMGALSFGVPTAAIGIVGAGGLGVLQGMAIGSVVPVFGTIVGGIVGGIIGAIAGGASGGVIAGGVGAGAGAAFAGITC